MQITTKFNINDKVKITELNRPGKVLSIFITDLGVQYYTRYFIDSKVETVYFYEDELDFNSRGVV